MIATENATEGVFCSAIRMRIAIAVRMKMAIRKAHEEGMHFKMQLCLLLFSFISSLCFENVLMCRHTISKKSSAILQKPIKRKI